jgi:pyoverdine/dityrosine biosynthesis protein Dit1
MNNMEARPDSVSAALSESALIGRFQWPSEDPRLRDQPSRPTCSSDDARLARAATPDFDLEGFLKRTQELSSELRIVELLNEACQFNSRSRFRDNEDVQERIRGMQRVGRPIEIVMPAFAPVLNTVKRFESVALSGAEDVSLRYLSWIADLITRVYEPGAIIHVVTDGIFYSSALGITWVEAHTYERRLMARVRELGLHNVVVHSMSEFLVPCHDEFLRNFDRHYHAIWKGQPYDGISAKDAGRLAGSLLAGFNTRKYRLTYAEMRNLFSADVPAEQRSAEWAPIFASVRESATNYRALRAALAELRWEEQRFPGAVRATIHLKKLPVLGMRLYPEYRRRSMLLPYHGIGVLLHDGSLTVEPEMFVCGRPEYTRVVAADGTTRFYEQTVS